MQGAGRESSTLLMLIGVDYHPSFQQITVFVEDTRERQLNHSEGEAEQFYRDLQQRGIRVRVGMEATGYARWFERLLAALGVRLKIDFLKLDHWPKASI